jgi:isopenicillin N synthase-like dioxygenase
VSAIDELAVIDVSGLLDGGPAAEVAIGRQIDRACLGTGLFYIEHHGVDAAIVDDAMALALEFFRLPDEVKRRCAVNRFHRGFNALGDALMYGADKPDYKEFFQIGLELPEDDPDVLAGQPLRGPNQWPPEPRGLHDALRGYFDAVGDCGRRLLRAVAAGLGLDHDFFECRYAKPLQRTQAVYYPPQPADLGSDQFGVAPHSDFGCITLLAQDHRGGLEVELPDGRWAPARPLPGTFVVNVGDLLERWTNDRYRSTKHRVINRSGAERLSIATFYDPSYTATVDPRDLGILAGAVPRYEPVAAGDHIAGRIDASFGYRSAANT